MQNNPYQNIKIKTKFTRNEDCIVFLLKLKNGNLATCSQDREINIFEKKTFNLLLSWTGHLNSINCICELNNSRLASCSDDKRISIWQYDIPSKKVKIGRTYGELPIPTREGYTFKGWNGKNLLDYNEVIDFNNWKIYKLFFSFS